jgi:sialate O-acetylesterase
MNPCKPNPTHSLALTIGVLLALCPAARTLAAVRLPALFSEHMVLQQGKPAPVWGWAEPGEAVTVSIAGQTKTTRAAATGKWLVKLSPIAGGGPYSLHVKGQNDLTVEDVLVGEVWLGSGQSNMAHPAAEARDFESTKAAADLPALRMFKVESKGATNAQDDCVGSWKVCSAETVGRFSAVLFFFGRELHQSLGVPVGLINSSVGATAIESWISPKAQKAAHGEGELFNGKIAPLIPYALAGAIWYQGEANARSVEQARNYHTQLVTLVKDWRARWGYPFPFAWAQLPNFSGRTEAWCLVREGQLQALELPRSGMAITVDIGDSGNIHPKNKQETGRRLSLWALGTVYGKPVPATSGPLPAGQRYHAHEVVLKFTHTEGGLTAPGGALKGFTIAGDDRQWQPAQARIVGDTVVVANPAVTKPVAVRYAWQDNPDCNLFNGAGLPASPFRTDQWQ